jgi:hypothetical protein
MALRSMPARLSQMTQSNFSRNSPMNGMGGVDAQELYGIS